MRVNYNYCFTRFAFLSVYAYCHSMIGPCLISSDQSVLIYTILAFGHFRRAQQKRAFVERLSFPDGWQNTIQLNHVNGLHLVMTTAVMKTRLTITSAMPKPRAGRRLREHVGAMPAVLLTVIKRVPLNFANPRWRWMKPILKLLTLLSGLLFKLPAISCTSLAPRPNVSSPFIHIPIT